MQPIQCTLILCLPRWNMHLEVAQQFPCEASLLHLGVELDSDDLRQFGFALYFLPRPGWTQDVQTNWALRTQRSLDRTCVF